MIKNFWAKIQSVFFLIKSAFFSKAIYIGDVEINGTAFFCDKINSTLELLKNRDIDSFQAVVANVSEIIEGRTTAFSFSRWGVSLSLSEVHFNESSPIWLAGLLAYAGFRAELFLENLKKYSNSREMPKELYSGKKVWDLRYECLRKLGAEYEELRHLADFIETQEFKNK